MASDETTNASKHAEHVCPECATPQSQRSVPPPWLVRHRRPLQFVALLVALCYVVWIDVQEQPFRSPPTTYPNVPYAAEFPESRITRADVERYASGEIADGRLLKDLHVLTLGTYELGATFVPPRGDIEDYVRYGWPMCVIRYSYQAEYNDVYSRTDPLTTRAPLRNGWWTWEAYVNNKIDEQGRLATLMFLTQGLMGLPLALVAMWFASRALRWIVYLLHVSQRDGQRKRDRFVRRIPTICLVLCATCVIIASVVPQHRPSWASPVPWNPTCADTGVTNADFGRFAVEPIGEAALAIAILEATTNTDPESCLAFAWGTKSSLAGSGWRIGNLISGDTFGEEGAQTVGRRVISFRRENGRIAAWVRWSGTDRVIDTYGFAYRRATTKLLNLCAVWVGVGLCVWTIGFFVRRRSARRIAKGQCVRCAYDLSGLGLDPAS